MQCAPITIAGFKHHLADWNATTIPTRYRDPAYDSVAGYTGYAYGPQLEFGSDYSFVYFNTTSGYALGNLQYPSYYIDGENSHQNTSGVSGTWSPISQLDRTDADVLIWFLLQNDLNFVAPSNDPLFGAKVPR